MPKLHKNKSDSLKSRAQNMGIFLKNHRLSLSSLFFVLVVGYALTAYWLGTKAEQTFWKQYELIKSLPSVEVKTFSYRRGFFFSESKMQLQIKPEWLSQHKNYLPDHLQKLLSQPIDYTQNIQHGPILYAGGFDLSIGQALGNIRIKIDPQTRHILQTLFPTTPITIRHYIDLKGNGQLAIKIPALSYHEILSGLDLAWQETTILISHSQDFSSHGTTISLPHFALTVPQVGSINIDKAYYLIQHNKPKNKAQSRTLYLTIQNLQTHLLDSTKQGAIELGQWMTRLRDVKKTIDVINAQYLSHPSSILLQKLNYQLVTHQLNHFINTQGILEFNRLKLDCEDYGSVSLDVTVNHLYEPVLSQMWSQLKEAIFLHKTTHIRQAQLAIIKQYAGQLFIHHPEIKLHKLHIRTKSGTTKITGRLSLKKFGKNHFALRELLKSSRLDAHITIPRKALEEFIIAYADRLFLIGSTKSAIPNLKEAQALTKNLLDLQIEMLKTKKWIEEKSGNLTTIATLQDGILQLNHKKITSR